MSKAFSHFKTITKHRHAVIRNCAKSGILWQGLRHDLSKYSPIEFRSGAEFYQGDRSPNDKEREQNGYSKAWVHHMGRNPHHFEYWRDYSPKDKIMRPIEMPFNYVVEMFCDRVAASKIYQGDRYTDKSALSYFEQGKQRRVNLMHQKTSDTLEELLTMLAQQGEKKTFAHIRKLMKEYRYEQRHK